MKYNAVSKPLLFDSQLKARLNLAKKRMESYPVSDLNVMLMDLEHPVRRRRHADFCTVPSGTERLPGKVSGILRCC